MSERFMVKALKPGARGWKFVTPRGGLNGLKMHGATFSREAADRTIALNLAQCPGWHWQVVPVAEAPAREQTDQPTTGDSR